MNERKPKCNEIHDGECDVCGKYQNKDDVKLLICLDCRRKDYEELKDERACRAIAEGVASHWEERFDEKDKQNAVLKGNLDAATDIMEQYKAENIRLKADMNDLRNGDDFYSRYVAMTQERDEAWGRSIGYEKRIKELESFAYCPDRKRPDWDCRGDCPECKAIAMPFQDRASEYEKRIKELEATKNGIDNLASQLYKKQKRELADLKSRIASALKIYDNEEGCDWEWAGQMALVLRGESKELSAKINQRAVLMRRSRYGAPASLTRAESAKRARHNKKIAR